jgi:hypothetical protein
MAMTPDETYAALAAFVFRGVRTPGYDQMLDELRSGELVMVIDEDCRTLIRGREPGDPPPRVSASPDADPAPPQAG